MTLKKDIVKSVPELYFIGDNSYSFSVSVNCKKERPALLNKNYLKIGRVKLPLTMDTLSEIRNFYDDGEVNLSNVKFCHKEYDYEILYSKDSMSICATRRFNEDENGRGCSLIIFSGVVGDFKKYSPAQQAA
ncbi:hypothetical protein AGMMS49938_19000 [Fibrobacterales bacterium]|nr:hypothetical protein AGMMS49938_19000 [Fibrobacterales bacterium]